MVELFNRVVDSLSPSYRIERDSINEMCNLDTGLPGIPEGGAASPAPQIDFRRAGESIPSHRLIRNLIDLEKFDLAETEIRVFESDLGRTPLCRAAAVLRKEVSGDVTLSAYTRVETCGR
ncbi:MAG: hypothetical protein E5Y88_33270 [Mesorhizobium sp.]|uniref:hypothetical protein n=1 Tax=Mesorhizobium sp. TaxID=1871066 RepID=UPI00120A665E|nr:hypothetical protein [Mesorhizobium sp.]TIL19619.1 MAG: hypothetical protein E5Y88_33270 [Mesorhizobium sp.]